MVVKDLALAEVTLARKYAMWFDLRTTDDDQLHGSGKRVVNASEGITILITKQAEAAGQLNMYMYVLMGAQLKASVLY